MKKRMISFLLMVSVLLFTSTLTLSFADVCDYNGIGRVFISTIPMPSTVALVDCATYTYSGKVLVTYKTANDINTTDFWNIAVCNDDGTCFKNIFSGVITPNAKANGIRYMPFQDNKRVLLGDYVLECTPDIDCCKNATLVPIVYPAVIDTDARIGKRWSEVIIAPDNKHMAWSVLTPTWSLGQFIGVLSRQTNSYVLENVQFLKSPGSAGEVKQFVKGGNAISSIGAEAFVTTDSVIQDLAAANITQITYTPGYDETTILSPDEHLGITMTTRFSTNTDPAIIGIMPRPSYIALGLSGCLYSYSVTGVRDGRSGNVGPALININRSMNVAGYKGISLNTDENWAYYSPMSWHPSGKRAIWMEGLKGSSPVTKRMQKVTLLDYIPSKPVPIVTTTEKIPYGTSDLNQFYSSVSGVALWQIAGKSSGYVILSYTGTMEAQYINYSDDGVNFYNGYEKSSINFTGESSYEANLQLTGPIPGIMNLRATFGPIFGVKPACPLLFDIGADGQCKSYGYATYNGVTLYINDLIK